MHIRTLARALALSASDWRLLIAATGAQILVALALRLMPLPALCRRVARLRRIAQRLMRSPENRVTWAIEASGRRLPGISTCLVRAIVGELVLNVPERPVRVNIGIKRGAAGDLLAHAWLADDDRVLIGGDVADEYMVLLAWNSLFT
jgi:hypothetical protein